MVHEKMGRIGRQGINPDRANEQKPQEGFFQIGVVMENLPRADILNRCQDKAGEYGDLGLAPGGLAQPGNGLEDGHRYERGNEEKLIQLFAHADEVPKPLGSESLLPNSHLSIAEEK